MGRGYLVFALGLLACRAREVEVLDLETDQVVVGAIVGPDGRPRAPFAFWLEPNRPLRARIEVEDEDALVFWSTPASNFVDETGARPSDVELRALTADLGAQGGCGRCLAETRRAPQRVFPGDRCRPPAFARGSVLGELPVTVGLEELRAQVRLQWPGPCACELSSGLTEGTTSFEVREEPGGVEAEVYPLLAEGPDGSLAGFGAGRVLHIAVDGSTRSADISAAVPGLPLGVAAVTGGFLVARQTRVGADGNVVELHLFDHEFRRVAEYVTPLERLYAVEPLHDLGLVAFLGKGRQSGSLSRENANVLSCRADVAAQLLDCAEVVPPDLGDGGATTMVRTASGSVVLVLRSDAFLQFDRFPPPDAYGFSGDEHEGHLIASGAESIAYRVSTYEDLGISADPELDPGSTHHWATLGDRLYVCLSDETIAGRVYVFSVSIDASNQLLAGSARREACIDVRGLSPPSDAEWCRSFYRREDRLHLQVFGRGFLEFEANANPPMRPDECSSQLPRPESSLGLPGLPLRVQNLSSGGLLALDREGGVFVEAPGQTGFVRKHGVRAPQSHSALAEVGEELWSPSSSEVWIRPRDGGPPTTRAFTGPLPSTPEIAHLFEPEGALYVGGRHEASWLARFDRDALDLSMVSLPPPPDEGWGSMVGFLDLGRDLLLVTAHQGLHHIVADRAVPVPIEWDDPFTLEVEGPPIAVCREAFRSIDVSHGVGWIGGCDNLVLRVLPDGDGYYAERVFFEGIFQRLGVQQPVEGTAAICPDQLLAAIGLSDYAEASLALVRPAGEGALSLTPAPHAVAFRPQTLYGAFARGSEIFTMNSGVHPFFFLDRVLRSQTQRRAWAGQVTALTVTRDAELVVSTSYNRLLFVPLR